MMDFIYPSLTLSPYPFSLFSPQLYFLFLHPFFPSIVFHLLFLVTNFIFIHSYPLLLLLQLVEGVWGDWAELPTLFYIYIDRIKFLRVKDQIQKRKSVKFYTGENKVVYWLQITFPKIYYLKRYSLP
jgi:hypothetical protein